jgi:hypothetical protein
MSYVVDILDSEARARQKQLSRERDELRLASGAVSRDDLRKENGFFSALDLPRFKIAAIGGRPLGVVR